MVLDPMPDLLAPRLLVGFLVIASEQEDLHIWSLSQTRDLMSPLAECCIAMAIVRPCEGNVERIDRAQWAIRGLPVEISQGQSIT